MLFENILTFDRHENKTKNRKNILLYTKVTYVYTLFFNIIVRIGTLVKAQYKLLYIFIKVQYRKKLQFQLTSSTIH